MKQICLITLLFLTFSGFLISCGKDEDQIRRIERLEQRVVEESQQKEIALEEAVRSKTHLSLLIGGLIASVIIALLVGVAIGSKARRHAGTQMALKGDPPHGRDA